MRSLVSALALFFIAVLCPSRARAVVLDWDALTWTPGTLSNSFDIDPSFAGNDVAVAVTGNTAQFQPSLVAPNPATPAISRAFDGGLTPGQNTLELALNLTSNAQNVTVTVNFSNNYPAVGYVSFKLFDIDAANSGANTYQDLISSIVATSTTGATIAPTISGLGANVSLSGSGASQTLTGLASTVDTGAGSDAGNATIFFDATDIRSITFTYGSTSAFADPSYQHVGFFDLSFVATPEVSPACVGLLLCAIAGVFEWRRHIATRSVRRPLAS